MNRIIQTAIAAAALGLAGLAGAASAGPIGQDQMVVKVGDLNTHTPAGANSALRRIKNTAEAFCGGRQTDLQSAIRHQRCVKEMTGKAVAKLDAPMVTALYSGASPIQLAQTETTAR
jgi:UrcA family protein